MLGSAILDVAIGIVFIYVVLSMMCSAIREGLEAFIKSRSAALEYGIRELLHEVNTGKLTEAVYNHPEIYGMFAGSYQPTGRTQPPWWFTSGKNLPSYIPSRSFALALMDLVARGPVPVPGATAAAGGAENGWAMTSDLFSLPLIRANIRSIQNPWVERALLTALDTAGADLNAAIRNVEAWYDNAMERVSGRYRRSSQFVLFLIGLVIAAGFNINTLEIADYLYRNPTERAALVAKAEALTQTPGDANYNYRDVLYEVQNMRLPVGWPAVDRFAGSGGAEFLAWTIRGFGWLLTAFAVTLGAPFWFDVLNRFMLMRSTVKPADVKTQPAAPAVEPGGGAAGLATTSVSGWKSALADPDDGTEVAAVVPVRGEASDPDACTDGCEVSIASPTEDADLPAAQGGVA